MLTGSGTRTGLITSCLAHMAAMHDQGPESAPGDAYASVASWLVSRGALWRVSLVQWTKRRTRLMAARAVGMEPVPEPWPHVESGHHNILLHRIIHYKGDPPVWVRYGNYTGVGMGTQFIVGAIHPTEWVSTYPFRNALSLPGAFSELAGPHSRGDITIGSDCWIARDVTILSGVTVGHGAVLATRSVVTRDVRPYAVVAGNPAREVRRRYPDPICERLLEIAWWDWPHEDVVKAVPLLNGGTVEEFLEYAEERRQNLSPL